MELLHGEVVYKVTNPYATRSSYTSPQTLHIHITFFKIIISSAMAKKSNEANCLVSITEMQLRESSCAPKLKHEHVYLTSFSKMRVDLATQASSSYITHDNRL